MTEHLATQLLLHRTLQRALENFKKIGRANLNPAKIRSRVSALKEVWLQYQDGHIRLVAITPADAKLSLSYFKEDFYDVAESAYHDTLDHMNERLEELEPVSPNQSFSCTASRVEPSAFPLHQLPPIELPPFDGNQAAWEHFRDRFTALIRENKELSNFSRMHYLMSCLKGRALECISNLAVTANNFHTAWQTLIARFENRRRLINVHLSTLLNLPSVSHERATDLRTLSDKVNTVVASLKNSSRSPDELWNDMLVHLVVQKLDPATRKAWNLRIGDSDLLPSYDDLKRFLSHRASALDEDTPAASKLSSRSATACKVSAATASADSNPMCPAYKKKHFLYACPTFTSQTPSQRRDFVQKHKRCFNCLSPKHNSKACKSRFLCRVCRAKHHSMLHLDSESHSSVSQAQAPSCSSSPESVTPPAKPTSSESKPEVNSLVASTRTRDRTPVLLATAWVTVGVPFGRTAVVRALLDQGSEMTFMMEDLAQSLHVKRIRMPITISAVGGVNAGTFRHATRITISPRDSSVPSVAVTALILKMLTTYTPPRAARVTSLSHLANLQLADPDPTSADPIKLIIGADLYPDIIRNGLRTGRDGRVIAQNSILGWIISGPVDIPASNMLVSSTASVVYSSLVSSIAPVVRNDRIHTHHCLASLSLDQEIRRFWEIEEVPREIPQTNAEKQCENHFRETHTRDSTGRYVVRLPFRRGPPIEIGKSRDRAEQVLKSVTRKFQRDSELAREYVEFLSEYERLGHMRPAPSAQGQSEQHVYIPHHAVFRESSATTRLRVVFNASSVTSNGSSLNEHLLAGPKLQTEITSVILHWRNYKYVYSADIAKMYRQILVDPRDIDYQRILWKSSHSTQPLDYQLLTITYGTACAPFLALRVLQQLSHDEGHHFPLAVPFLRDNIYVDDVLFGADNEALARQSRDQLIGLLKRGRFDLRKWASNSSSLLSDIDDRDHGLAGNKTLSPDERLQILGIGWNPAHDVFTYQVTLPEQIPTTKRSILSAIAKLYDPLGWVTPVTVSAKIFMQNLWRVRLHWDDEVSDALLPRWRALFAKLSHLNGLRITRWTGFRPDHVQSELHGFADASTAAYAAAVYLRVVSTSGDVTCTLLLGKSKVAPLKPLSIPRLELSASVLLARLMDFVRKSLSFDSSSCYYWTDSTIALAWITQHPGRWKTFVANRVTEIQELTSNSTWRHVPTDANPADCASRGLLGDELANHPLWWRGPPWLQLNQEAWPSATPTVPPESPLEEKTVALQSALGNTPWDLASRFSAWPKLIRVTAYILKFIRLCRRKHSRRTGSCCPRSLSFDQCTDVPGVALTASDCQSAKFFWIKQIQRELFPSAIRSLIAGKSLPTRSNIFSLRPFLDPDSILRVGGRLSKAPFPFATRHPILLSPHPLVKLIVNQAHLRSLHAGPQLTLNVLRRDFWILRARNLVKSVIHSCVPCTRERAAVPTQIMGDLPEVRLSATSRSFVHCGVDYAGPVQIRASAGRGITSRKAYIALFVCLATKAIHLELVGDYSTPAFLNAYSRFCARRGLPQAMYSDNGTTFVGADREMTLAYRSAMQDPNLLNATASDNVTWNFIPPSAPHFGGLWEAGVKSVKNHLRRVLGCHTLTFEEFSTLLCRIEACLNSRPISPLSDTLEDYESLTPGHFLIGSALTVNPEASLLHLNENRLSRWQLVRHITERFWRLWQNDYVNTLQQRAKWRKPQPQIRIGQLVLLRNATLPPCKWELGRVTQCNPGSDGAVRVVTVKTATSEYQRPIVKLCVLPIDSEATSS